MVKETMIMNKIVELFNVEIYRCCKLDLSTGQKIYCHPSEKTKGFTGLYYEDDNNFFAIYPTTSGPIMYYKGIEYPLNKDLHIKVTKDGKHREFFIEEYGIDIKYLTSKYLDFDIWSTEMDVDLFYQIEQSYKDNEYYKKFTK